MGSVGLAAEEDQDRNSIFVLVVLTRGLAEHVGSLTVTAFSANGGGGGGGVIVQLCLARQGGPD
jgi:hypothetical protein